MSDSGTLADPPFKEFDGTPYLSCTVQMQSFKCDVSECFVCFVVVRPTSQCNPKSAQGISSNRSDSARKRWPFAQVCTQMCSRRGCGSAALYLRHLREHPSRPLNLAAQLNLLLLPCRHPARFFLQSFSPPLPPASLPRSLSSPTCPSSSRPATSTSLGACSSQMDSSRRSPGEREFDIGGVVLPSAERRTRARPWPV